MNIRIAGFGGQGIIMAGYVLGHGGILDGCNALQTQSYGSESRGGACKSDVIISDGEILVLAPSKVDVLIAMAQPAWDKYAKTMKDGAILIYESDLVEPSNGSAKRYGLPAMELARETFGREVVANVIMLGCLGGLTGVVSRESLRKAISENVPAKSVEMNLGAFDEGFKRGTEAKSSLQ
jgi:2-oxoglutarate ferredoxin oxidoreductase subunit gamma